MLRLSTSWRLAILTGALTFAAARSAGAAVIVTDCNFTCNADCELASDITCTSADSGVVLAGGADFDFKGHSLICNDPFTVDHVCGFAAVAMIASASVVRDTGSPRGGISGAFLTGVDCLSKLTSRVTGIAVEGVDGTGILNCANIENNVVTSTEIQHYPTLFGIQMHGVGTSGDTIRNNYVVRFSGSIKVTGSKPVSIDHNIIAARSPLGGGTGIAVNQATSAATSVDHNTFVGAEGGTIVGNATAQFAENHCDPTNPTCAVCITSHYCATPAVELCKEEPVTLKPTKNGDLNQFQYVHPLSPTLPAALRWLVVSDWVDAAADADFNSSVDSLGNTGVDRTELFHLRPIEAVDSTAIFSYCAIRAHMIGNDPSPAPVFLTMKFQSVSSDGTQINVQNGYPVEYSRIMAINPVTSMAWTGADLNDLTLQIGAKVLFNSNGVELGDLVLQCE